METFLVDVAREFWVILLDSGVWLVAGLLLAGVVHVMVPRDLLARHLAPKPGEGGRRARLLPIVKASLLGIPLPLCSCSVIPVAAGLRGAGASKGASAAFAISTPQTGEESIPLTWALFGPVYAFTRPVLAVATALAAGGLIELFGGDRGGDRRRGPSRAAGPGPNADLGPDADASAGPGGERLAASAAPGACCGGGQTVLARTPEVPAGTDAPAAVGGGSCCGGSGGGGGTGPEARAPVSLTVSTPSCCGSGAAGVDAASAGRDPGGASPAPASCCASDPGPADAGWAGKAIGAVRYAFGTMLRDLAPWLAVGLGLSAVIAAAVPEGWLEENVGTGLLPMLAMLVVGLPLYVCATSTTPLAYTLVVGGLSPGAALVLLLAGPATNMATMSWVLKDLGARALGIYLGVIAAFAVAGGLAFDALLSGTVRLAEAGHAHDHAVVSATQAVGAIALAALLAWALVSRYALNRPTMPDAAPAAAG